MGLDTSHDAWHGAYSSFMSFRVKIASEVGIPLKLMDGFYDEMKPSEILDFEFPTGFEHEIKNVPPKEALEMLPLDWDPYKDHPLFPLLLHSDCDGELEWKDCLGIAEALEAMVPKLRSWDTDWYAERAAQFAKGCRLAYQKKENIDFH